MLPTLNLEKQCILPPVPRTFRSSKFSMPTFSAWPVKFAEGKKKITLDM